MFLENGITKVLDERIETLELLQAEYDKTNRQLDPVAKSDMLEELLMKIELVLTLFMKLQRRLILQLDDSGSYMFKADIQKTLKETENYIKTYQGMAFALSEVLRSVRIKIENLYELQKLNMKQ